MSAIRRNDARTVEDVVNDKEAPIRSNGWEFLFLVNSSARMLFMDRKEQQTDLLIQFGAFVGPVLEMVKDLPSVPPIRRKKISAKYLHDLDPFQRLVMTFCQGEPGHDYSEDWKNAHFEMLCLRNDLFGGKLNDEQLAESVNKRVTIIRDSIMAIPVEVDPQIFSAQTPFATYRFINNLLMTSIREVVWQDPYFGKSLFHRHLVHVPDNVPIKLVTSLDSGTNKKDKQRIDEFLDVSSLFAVERTATRYSLVRNDDFHDRWLRCDDVIYNLGPSVKDLEKYFTIAPMEASGTNLQRFEENISKGTEVFGPNVPIHP